MTGLQRIRAALCGEIPDRVPVMLHNFMMAARQAAYSMRQFRESPEAVARSFIRAVEEFDYDGILLDIDTVTLAGAHMVSNGDSLAGPDVVSPRMYRQFAAPYEKRLVDAAHAAGLPYVLHLCGKTDRILEDMLATGADGLELDYKTDVHLAHSLMRSRATFIGNLDPSGVLALGTPELIEQKTRELVSLFADTPRFILNAGCAIPADTPPENLHAMIRAARGTGL